MNRLESDSALGVSFRIYLFLHGSFFIDEFLLKGLNVRSHILSPGFLFN